MRVFWTVDDFELDDAQTGAAVQVSGVTWDGVSTPSAFTPIRVAIAIDDNGTDIRKKIIDALATTFSVAKNDVVTVG